MRIVYVDSESKCHPFDDGTMLPVEAKLSDSKCDTFIEGYVCEIKEGSKAFYPWKPYNELVAAQAQYEADLAAAAAAYQEGVNSAYDQ